MAWFKNTAGENAPMSSPSFDKRTPRETFPDPRLAEFDLKSPLSSTPAAPAPRARVEAPIEAKPAERCSHFGLRTVFHHVAHDFKRRAPDIKLIGLELREIADTQLAVFMDLSCQLRQAA